eukprot:2164596-Prorocentrum_lima.AAC.1
MGSWRVHRESQRGSIPGRRPLNRYNGTDRQTRRGANRGHRLLQDCCRNHDVAGVHRVTREPKRRDLVN